MRRKFKGPWFDDKVMSCDPEFVLFLHKKVTDHLARRVCVVAFEFEVTVEGALLFNQNFSVWLESLGFKEKSSVCHYFSGDVSERAVCLCSTR